MPEVEVSSVIEDVAAADITKLDPSQLRTRADIIAEDFAPGTILCRGPRRLSAEQFDAGMAKRARLRAAVDVEGLRAMANALAGVFRLPIATDEPDLTAELTRTAELLDTRQPCGADLGVLRAQSGEPFDGKRHTQICPKCGETRYWWPSVSVEDYPTLVEAREAALSDALS